MAASSAPLRVVRADGGGRRCARRGRRAPTTRSVLTTQLPPRLLDDADGSDARAALSSHTPRFWLAVGVGVKRVPTS